MSKYMKYINNLEILKIVKKSNKWFLKLEGWIIHNSDNEELILKIDESIQYLEFNRYRKDVIDAYRTSNYMSFGFCYELEIKKFNNLEIAISGVNGVIILKQLTFDEIEKIEKDLVFNLENINIIKRDSKLFLKFEGWVIHYHNNDKLILKVDENEYILTFNKYRKDVIDVHRVDIDINLGFNYELEINRFKNIDLSIVEDNEIALIKKLEFNEITLKNNDLKVNFEKIEFNKSEDKINILIIGWILTNEDSSKLKILLRDNKNTELYFSDNFVNRIDIIEKYKDNKLDCGIYIKTSISKSIEKMQLFLVEDFIEYQVDEFDITTSLKRSIEHIQEDSYQQWVKNNSLNTKELIYIRDEINKFKYYPKISILMPVWNVEEKWLTKAIESVKKQLYPNWELCIADDYSTKTYIKPYLQQLQNEESRIKVIFKNSNENISAATNTAFNISTGEYILLMDHDDELTPNALFEIVKSLQIKDKPEIIYSDDDKIDENGNRYDPQFKPNWSPELLLSFMYFSHIFCFKRELYEKVGGCRIGFEGCQDYDLALRITELTNKIKHIDTILYHWRSIKGSTAYDGNSKPEAFENGIKSVQQALNRRGINGIVKRPEFAKRSALGIFTIDFQNTGPEVSIIIPTKNNKPLLERCINSIITKTKYRNYKIVIINNESSEDESIKYIDTLRNIYCVLDIPSKENKFSFSYINNEAVDRIDSEYILFLNDDTEVINPNWLSSMMGYGQIDGVGIVGARLLLADNRVQHAGVVLGLYNGMVSPVFKLLPDYSLGYLNFAKVARNYSAVTAACMLIKKDLFINIGGFDEERFAVAYNDVDLCIKCLNYGKRIVYTPESELYHYEGTSRGYIDNIEEVLFYKRLYGNYSDKYYNKNLSLYNEQFRINPENSLGYTKNLSNKKILFCTHNLNYEGAPLHIYDIVKGIKSKYENCNIIIISPQDGPLNSMYKEIDVRVYIYQFNIFNNLQKENYCISIEKIKQIINIEKFDFVFANTLETFYFIDIAIELQIPSIWNIHESVNYKLYFKRADNYVVNKYIYCFNNATKVVFVCDSTLKMYNENNLFNNFDYIYNGIDRKKIDIFKSKFTKKEIKRNLDIPEFIKVVTIIGTVCERKGQLDFVKAAINIIKNRNDVIFYVVGCRECEYLDEIKYIINKNNYHDKIILVEETENVYLYYRATDVFVCASYNESFPRVTLEAMAFDLPIVSTPVFGLKEQVIENINGLYFNPGDINKLEININNILNDDELCKKLSSNSNKVLSILNSYDEMLEKYINIIKRNI